jgi:uncharacterized alkaline shock family protein YloU
MTKNDTPGKTTVSPDVLVTIARLSTLSVPGVVNRLFRRGNGDGVRIETEENTVFADLYFVVKQDVNIREVSRNIQKQVARAIQEMVGMEIGHINIHIEDIDYEEPARPDPV